MPAVHNKSPVGTTHQPRVPVKNQYIGVKLLMRQDRMGLIGFFNKRKYVDRFAGSGFRRRGFSRCTTCRACRAGRGRLPSADFAVVAGCFPPLPARLRDRRSARPASRFRPRLRCHLLDRVELVAPDQIEVGNPALRLGANAVVASRPTPWATLAASVISRANSSNIRFEVWVIIRCLRARQTGNRGYMVTSRAARKAARPRSCGRITSVKKAFVRPLPPRQPPLSRDNQRSLSRCPCSPSRFPLSTPF